MLSTRLTIIAVLAAAWCWTSDGQNYDVACPGVNNELQCPKGQVIEVLSMQQGDMSAADCDARSNPAKVTDEHCLASGLLDWTKFICNNREHCRLPIPDPRMFVCGYSGRNFVQISYNCNQRRAGELTSVTCEGKDAEIKCEKGVLDIVKASFGRFDKTTCTDIPSSMTYCSSYGAAQRVRDMCEGKGACTIKIDPDSLGTPAFCDALPEYLTVDYVCQ